MISLNNDFIAEAFPTRELKKMQAEITRVLKEREEEREKVKRQYQKELDRLLDAIKDDEFFIDISDFPSRRITVIECEDA